MKFIKVFEEHSQYVDYIGSSNPKPILPNLSYCRHEDCAHLNSKQLPCILLHTTNPYVTQYYVLTTLNHQPICLQNNGSNYGFLYSNDGNTIKLNTYSAIANAEICSYCGYHNQQSFPVDLDNIEPITFTYEDITVIFENNSLNYNFKIVERTPIVVYTSNVDYGYGPTPITRLISDINGTNPLIVLETPGQTNYVGYIQEQNQFKLVEANGPVYSAIANDNNIYTVNSNYVTITDSLNFSFSIDTVTAECVNGTLTINNETMN